MSKDELYNTLDKLGMIDTEGLKLEEFYKTCENNASLFAFIEDLFCENDLNAIQRLLFCIIKGIR